LLAATKLYFEQLLENPRIAKAFHIIMVGSFYSLKFNKLSTRLNAESISIIERAIRAGIKQGSVRSDINPKIWSVIYLAAAVIAASVAPFGRLVFSPAKLIT
jgi:hypothetical protein